MSPLQFLTVLLVLLAIAVNVSTGYAQGAWFAGLLAVGLCWLAAVIAEVRR